MEELIEYILQFGDLNQQQINLISKKTTELQLQRGDYFSEAGKIPKQVGFPRYRANLSRGEYCFPQLERDRESFRDAN